MYHPQNWIQPSSVSREIIVTGNGAIDAQPDYAQVLIEVRTEGKDVSQAQQENAIIMNRVIGSLVALNIPREAIQTTVYTISPNYDYIEGRQVFRGFEVQNAITVQIADISRAGTVIDTAIQNGANHVSSIQFKIEDSDAYYQRALQMALINAIEKAKTMAETMRIALDPIPIEMIEESQHNAPIPYSAQLSNREMMTPIAQGTMAIQASVRVTFRY
ncbi:SIMPL domain-containing protein [Solibacillus sp. FSL R7-0668]|uniref:SIMPL domain-containing protein n=1 Tax=Solibacillus sp. FSL R7-0668 TaxID=2921688 RepID=UPI0030F6542B